MGFLSLVRLNGAGVLYIVYIQDRCFQRNKRHRATDSNWSPIVVIDGRRGAHK